MTLCDMTALDQHTIDRQPLSLILAFWQLDRLPQASTAQRSLSKLLELPVRAALARFLRPKRRSGPRVSVKIIAIVNFLFLTHVAAHVPRLRVVRERVVVQHYVEEALDGGRVGRRLLFELLLRLRLFNTPVAFQVERLQSWRAVVCVVLFVQFGRLRGRRRRQMDAGARFH
jgi:hypothetical protein